MLHYVTVQSPGDVTMIIDHVAVIKQAGTLE